MILPLFPLPNVVLFPGCFLPLHVFEARYRGMIAEAEAGDRMIVVALLKPGWEPEYHNAPPVHEIACAGRIVGAERLEDGRYNILVEGVDRVRILDEVREKSWRQVIVRTVEPTIGAEIFDRRAVLALLNEIISFAPVDVPEGLLDRLSSISADGLLADTLAHILQIPIPVKQMLLETAGVDRRMNLVFERLRQLRRRLGPES